MPRVAAAALRPLPRAFLPAALTLVAIATMSTVYPIIRSLHRRQLRAFTGVRSAIAELLTTFNEMLSGGDAIRSYGYEETARGRMRAAIGRHTWRASSASGWTPIDSTSAAIAFFAVSTSSPASAFCAAR